MEIGILEQILLENDDIMLEELFKRRRKDLPRVIVACSTSLSSNYAIGENKRPLPQDYIPVLKKRIEDRIGDIGTCRVDCPCHNTVGSCAEPHAANNYLKKFAITEIDELLFSKAYLSGLHVVKPYCQNCLDTFDQLSNE